MSYNINYSDSSKTPITIEDNTVDTTTSIELLGKNYAKGYGEIIATNFLHLLENFASTTAPTNPTIGQIWYDTQTNLLKVYTINSTWKELSTTYASSTPPTSTGNENIGDLWINNQDKELYAYMGGEWVLVFKYDETDTVAESKTRQDITGNPHITYEISVNGKTVIVISSDSTAWIPRSTGNSPELLKDNTLMVDTFPTIEPGLNLYNRNPAEVTITDENPNTDNPYLKTGDIWINEDTNETWVYNTSSWLKISNTKLSTRVVARQRLDSLSVQHETLETIVDGKIIFIDSAEETAYTLNSSELDEDGNPLVNTFYEEIQIGRNGIPTPTQLISYVPSGAVQAFAMQTVPEGWLACNGSAISRTTYSRLFNLIGTTYGAGDGSTTFNLPDLRGEFIRGWDNSRGVDSGRTFGSSQSDQLKSHTHQTGRIYVDANDGGIDHWVMTETGQPSTSGDFDTDSTGGNETRPRNIALQYCIKT